MTTRTRADTPSCHEAFGQALRRHLEDREQLLFTSRALSVSEMASVLAHELNQPIGTVVNLLRGIEARLLATGAPVDAEIGEALRIALEQAVFASRIVARIRGYTLARRQRVEALDLAIVVRESLSLLDWDLQRHGVNVSTRLEFTSVRTTGDKVMLQQVLVNLLRNALDAMHATPMHKRRLQVTLAKHGRLARISIEDSGCGLSTEAERRLFAPFHSTKPNGLGIGLNICRSFVELHQGRLWFTRQDAEPGSTFHIELPLDPTNHESTP